MEMAADTVDAFTNFFSVLGVYKGLLVIILIGSQYWIYRLYSDRLEDRQKEIDRLAQENRQYRERFLALLDKKFKYKK